MYAQRSQHPADIVLCEAAGQIGQFLRAHSYPAIDDNEAHGSNFLPSLRRADLQADLAAIGEFQRVIHQAHQDLANAPRVAQKVFVQAIEIIMPEGYAIRRGARLENLDRRIRNA